MNKDMILIPICGAAGGSIAWIARGGCSKCYENIINLFLNNPDKFAKSLTALFIDMFIGIFAAIVVFFILGLLKIEYKGFGIRTAGISCLAGFMGLIILNSGKDTFQNILKNKVNHVSEQVEKIKNITQSNDLIQQGQMKYDVAIDSLNKFFDDEKHNDWKMEHFRKGIMNFKLAIERYNEAKKIDKKNKLIYIRIAKSYFNSYRLYQYFQNISKPENLDQYKKKADVCKSNTLLTINTLIKNNKEYGRAYYNRACYRSIFKEKIDGIIRDLQNAFKHTPGYKDIYMYDKDIMNNPEHERITEALNRHSTLLSYK